MTERRHLKKLVRERMARTGESYTTAHQQVLARAVRPPVDGLPPGVVPGYPGFGAGQHHESTLLAHLMAQAGHVAPHTGEPYSEAMICGLGGGIGFLYAVFEYAGHPPMLTIVAQHHPDPWVPGALGRLGVGYVEQRGAGRAALGALDEAITGGRAVYCTVDRTGLPWHAGEPALSSDPYPVVVTGVDGEELLLDDDVITPRRLARTQFAAAWSGLRKGRHHRILVDRPAGRRSDLPAALRAAVATTVAHLTGPVLGNSFDVNFGFSGMRRLADQLRDERTRNGWASRFGDPDNLALGLRRLTECLEIEYTASGATRPLYADFLIEAAGVLGEDRLSGAAALFRVSGQLWSRVADRAAEAAAEVGLLAGADGQRALRGELADLVDTARDAEERAVALLQR